MEKRYVELGQPIRQDKIVINGKADVRDVYRVNIKNLFYNDENGRIATFMAKYNSENDLPISELEFDAYNDEIMQFIIKSESKDSYRTTYDNIKEVGQLEPGIILKDGRVIDGNRRFTCLRDLYSNYHSEQFLYFECFVLEVPKTKEERAALKALELAAQYGTATKVAYNPVDRLADVYKDLVGSEKLFTPDEYMSRLNNTTKLSEIKTLMVESETLWDYLDFNGQTGRWDIARDFKLEGPIRELALLRKKIGEEEWVDIAPVFYTQMLHISGDRTREMRRIIDVYKSDPARFDEIRNAIFEAEIKSQTLDLTNDTKEKKEKAIEVQKSYQDIDKKITKAVTEAGINKAKNRQLKLLEDITQKLGTIDKTAIRLSDDKMKKELKNEIEIIERKLASIKAVIE